VQVDAIRITSSCRIPMEELTLRFSRSGGPGGQNVNKRETRVELVFDVAHSSSLGPRQRARAMERLRNRLDSSGRLRIVASQARTQARNRELAIGRFQKVLADALRPPPPARKPSKPSRGAKERRLESKHRRARLKRNRTWIPEE
jgi:ribosome-associated protein